MRDVDTLRVDGLQRTRGWGGCAAENQGLRGTCCREPGAVLRSAPWPSPAVRSCVAVPSEAVLQEVSVSCHPTFVFLPCLVQLKDRVRLLEDGAPGAPKAEAVRTWWYLVTLHPVPGVLRTQASPGSFKGLQSVYSVQEKVWPEN